MAGDSKSSSGCALFAVTVVVVLCALTAIVPGFGPRSFAERFVGAVAGPRCDDRICPPDAPWVRPVEADVTSQFRSASRPNHHGVDMAAASGTPVVAASAGVVIVAECQARRDGEPYDCDRDGTPEVRGCGWYVKVLHADHIATLYCHLESAPLVAVGDAVGTGQVIGAVGSSGNSSEPHLHFEAQVGGAVDPPRSANAVDPESFMAARGAPLDVPTAG